MRQGLLKGLERILPVWTLSILGKLGQIYTRHCPLEVGKFTVVECKKLFRLLSLRRFEAYTNTIWGTRHLVRFPDQIQRFLFFFGVWEPAVSRFVEESLEPGDVFVDIGANIGYYSVLASKLVGPAGTVYAIEALPSTYEELIHSKEVNHCHNIQASNCLVLDSHSEEEIFAGREQNLGCTGLFRNKCSPHSVGTLSAYPLHEIVEKDALYNARLIKVDVEGSEWRVIKGLEDQLGLFSDRTEWLIEIDPERMRELGGSVEAFRDMFRRAGYHDYVFENPFDVGWYIKNCYSFQGKQKAELVHETPHSFANQVDILFTKQRY